MGSDLLVLVELASARARLVLLRVYVKAKISFVRFHEGYHWNFGEDCCVAESVYLQLWQSLDHWFSTCGL